MKYINMFTTQTIIGVKFKHRSGTLYECIPSNKGMVGLKCVKNKREYPNWYTIADANRYFREGMWILENIVPEYEVF